MKRSEMLKKIKALGESDDYYSWYYITPERILEMVESLGMLPPYNENHGISNYDLAMGQPVEATNKWENEDEEK